MPNGAIEVQCPCCEARLKVDVETGVVLSHKVPEKPKMIEDLAAEVAKLKGAESRRDEVFRKQMDAHRQHGKVLERKFDELFKQVQDDPEKDRPLKRDFDLD